MRLIGCTQVLVDVPPARIWALLADVAGWRSWMPGIRWAVLEGALESGSYVTVKPERGRQTAYRVDDVAAPVRLALGLTFGPVAALRRTWIVESSETGTRVSYTIEDDGPLRRVLITKTATALHAAAPALLAALREAALA